jgi:ketosteroid isomerase-like protein
MSEDSTTPDPVALTRALSEADDVDATMRFYGDDAVYDLSALGMGVFVGRAAIRSCLEDWFGSYEEYEDEPQQILDLGDGVVFAAIRQNARPSGSPDHVRLRDLYGYVFVWADDKVARVTPYRDVDEARAAAERLAEERG